MRFSALLLFAFVIITGCNSSNKKSNILSTDNLPLQEYTIDVNKDTTLVTKNGAMLKIPKGALVSGSGTTVTLEIQEAYSMQQMIQGGLVTQSNGEPLSSGGMIYINAKAGQDVKITQAIKVAIPSDYLADGMQLFKGQKDENGNINWEEPTALSENKQLSSIGQGQLLFQSKCASCHAIGKDLSGPDLAHFPKRIPYGESTSRYWYHYFKKIYTPYSIDEKGKVDSDYLMRWVDPYACNLINRYGGIAVGEQTRDWHEMNSIYAYIQNESDRRNLPLPAHAYLYDCTDSCDAYKSAVADLQRRKETAQLKKDELVKENGSLVEEKKEQAPQANIIDEQVDSTPPPPVNYEEKVSPENYDAEYYQFTIETFGWFNIDILMKGMNGVEESELFVRITGEYREKIQVYLIIPSVKVNVEGGPAERDPQEFAFYLKNGKIPLNATLVKNAVMLIITVCVDK